jgi:hypothetical protein
VNGLLAPLAIAMVLAGSACPAPTVAVPAKEPHVTLGRSGLVAGIYIQGGAIIPGCTMLPRGPYAGTVTVFNAKTGARVASETLRADGHLFRIALAPGTYEVRARERGGGLRIGPLTVTIPRGHRVRDDLFIDVP